MMLITGWYFVDLFTLSMNTEEKTRERWWGIHSHDANKIQKDHLCGGAGKARNCRILKKLSYSVIIKIDPFCHIMHLKFLIYLK